MSSFFAMYFVFLAQQQRHLPQRRWMSPLEPTAASCGSNGWTQKMAAPLYSFTPCTSSISLSKVCVFCWKVRSSLRRHVQVKPFPITSTKWLNSYFHVTHCCCLRLVYVLGAVQSLADVSKVTFWKFFLNILKYLRSFLLAPENCRKNGLKNGLCWKRKHASKHSTALPKPPEQVYRSQFASHVVLGVCAYGQSTSSSMFKVFLSAACKTRVSARNEKSNLMHRIDLDAKNLESHFSVENSIGSKSYCSCRFRWRNEQNVNELHCHRSTHRKHRQPRRWRTLSHCCIGDERGRRGSDECIFGYHFTRWEIIVSSRKGEHRTNLSSHISPLRHEIWSIWLRSPGICVCLCAIIILKYKLLLLPFGKKSQPPLTTNAMDDVSEQSISFTTSFLTWNVLSTLYCYNYFHLRVPTSMCGLSWIITCPVPNGISAA